MDENKQGKWCKVKFGGDVDNKMNPTWVMMVGFLVCRLEKYSGDTGYRFCIDFDYSNSNTNNIYGNNFYVLNAYDAISLDAAQLEASRIALDILEKFRDVANVGVKALKRRMKSKATEDEYGLEGQLELELVGGVI